MTLRSRFALTVALVATLATLIAALLSYRSTEVRLDRAVNQSLVSGIDRQIERITHRSPRARRNDELRFPGARDPRGINDGPGLSEELLALQLLDQEGNIVQAVGPIELPIDDADRELAATPENSRTPKTRLRTVKIGSDRYRIATKAIPGFGGIQAARNVEENAAVLSELLKQLAFLVVATSTAAAIAGWMMARTATKSLRALTVTASTIADTGDLSHRVGTSTQGNDEASKLASAFDRMTSALATSRDQQKRLVQDASHELRTPLTSLRTNLAVLPKLDRLSVEDRERLVNDVRSEVEELVVLVDELVDHATQARGDEAPEIVFLADVARSCVARVTRRTGREINIESDQSAVLVPPSSIERAILNLINNAVKFAPAGSTITVTIAQGTTTVTDQGTGIAPEDLTRVFDRFYRAVDKQGLPGSGLGLSIVSDVAHRWGGSVRAQNAAPHGAAVSITLPLAP